MSYERFKTPFLLVEVGDSTGKNLIPLPYQIHRLIDRIEIKELLVSPGCTTGQFNMVFNEGSREPYATNKPINTSLSYPVDSTGTATLTNRAGMLADLNYVAQGGAVSLTSLFPSETGIIVDDLAEIADAGLEAASDLAGDLLEAATGTSPKVIIVDNKKAPKKPLKFLFQQNNQIKITWGYVEDLQNRRSVRGYISMIQFDYPENDHPKVTVTCAELGMRFDQVSGIFGTSFFNKIPAGATLAGDVVFNFEDLTVKELIEEFSSKAGMADPIVSDEYDEITLDKYAVKTIPAGMSPHQFFMDLANKYNAYYKATIDPSTGDDVIIFLSKKEYNSKLLISDTQLLTWKGPGSIVKSVQLRAEFNALAGNAQVGVNEKGEMVGVATKSNVKVGMVGSNAEVMDTDPTGNNPIQGAKGAEKALNTKMVVGTSQYNPGMNDIEMMKVQASSKAHCQLHNIVVVSLSTLGFAKLRPGPLQLGGLGQRFSGVYYFKEVTHTIDSAGGYVCRLEGSNQSDYGGLGKSADGFTKTQGDNQQVSAGLVNSSVSPSSLLNAAASAATGGSASDKYNKMQEGQ